MALNLNIGAPVSSPGFQELLLGDGSDADQQKLQTMGGSDIIDPQFDSILSPLPAPPKIGSPGMKISFTAPGGQEAGGSESVSQSTSRSDPRILTPDSGEIGQDFGQLQGGIGINQPQSDALGVTQQNGNTVRGLLGQSGQGQEARINNQFDTMSNNVSGSLIGRGFGGSSSNIAGQNQVEGARQNALSALNLGRLDENRANESGTAKGLSDILFGSANQSTDLLGGILGASGIGNFSTSQGSSVTESTDNGPKDGGVSMKSKPKPKPAENPKPKPGETQQEADDRVREAYERNNPSGGGGGGGGAETTNNPYTDGSGGGGKAQNNPYANMTEQQQQQFANDPQTQNGIPLEDQELEEDRGPRETPDEFARNQARLDAKDAANRAKLAAINGGGAGNGVPPGQLAGGAGDALGGGYNTSLGEGLA